MSTPATTLRQLEPATTIELDARHRILVWSYDDWDATACTFTPIERIQVYRTYKGDDNGAVLAGDTMPGATRETAIARGRVLAAEHGFAS